MTQPQLFIAEALKTDTEDCIDWPFSGNGNGYGKLHWRGIRQYAHRAILREKSTPPIGKSLALHTCDNKSCINYHHLYWGDKSDNGKDAVADHIRKYGRVWNAVISLDDITKIVADRRRQWEIAEEYGISQSWVSTLKKRYTA